jgi:quercetin dioxygenase-like cupin family protein/uncharacterized protein YndB with AHSA1/START domain
MLKPGAVLDLTALGVRVEMRRSAAETGGELTEFDVVGRARGFLTRTHAHSRQTERLEVIDGLLRLVVGGRDRVLHPGESMEVPAGVPHRQLPAGDGEGRVRVQVRPAGTTEAFLERLTTLELNRFGYPRLREGLALMRDFREPASREYVFVDEWDVAAPPAAVFAAIADARTYPDWWRPVYLDVDADGEPVVGKESRQHFKGRLPYHLRTRSRIVRLEPPHVVEAEVEGDLRGHGKWTLTTTPSGTHVRFDWRVHADRRLLRVLTPLLRPAFRWNHNWAIARAIEGLEPYVARTA